MRFRSLVLDVDSTLCGIEGISFLAARRGPEVTERVAKLTDRAMHGEIALDLVYGERLALVRPSAEDLAVLCKEYVRTLAPGAGDVISALRAAGVRIALVSGGIRQAIEPVARSLGVGDEELAAVRVELDERGAYRGFDTTSPLTTQSGKAAIVRTLLDLGHLTRPVLAVGDGSTDVPMRTVADAFAAYVGFTLRASVVAEADLVVETFEELRRRVLG
jgi:phosphoserine phosphatase